MKHALCLPIIAARCALVSERIDAHTETYDMFEVWLDYLEDLEESWIEDLLAAYPDRLIFLFRRLRLENPAMNPDLRRTRLSRLLAAPCTIDLDIGSQREDLDFCQSTLASRACRLITSYHNYDETPPLESLQQTVEAMAAYRPNIYKIAAFCKNQKDALTLLTLLSELVSRQRAPIILGMGAAGVITRIAGPLWGNVLTFVPEQASEASAPGQLTRAELSAILETIERGRK